jgi:hypothetical protein
VNVWSQGRDGVRLIKGKRANAACKSHLSWESAISESPPPESAPRVGCKSSPALIIRRRRTLIAASNCFALSHSPSSTNLLYKCAPCGVFVTHLVPKHRRSEFCFVQRACCLHLPSNRFRRKTHRRNRRAEPKHFFTPLNFNEDRWSRTKMCTRVYTREKKICAWINYSLSRQGCVLWIALWNETSFIWIILSREIEWVGFGWCVYGEDEKSEQEDIVGSRESHLSFSLSARWIWNSLCAYRRVPPVLFQGS